MLNLLAATVLTLIPPMGADHPKTPVFNDGWSKELTALINGKNRVHGFFVNWEDVFFFQGSTREFNSFLKSYSQVPGKPTMVIFHKGKLTVKSPWDKKPRALRADWRLSTVTRLEPGKPYVPEMTLELWLGGSVVESKVVLPKGIVVVEDVTRS